MRNYFRFVKKFDSYLLKMLLVFVVLLVKLSPRIAHALLMLNLIGSLDLTGRLVLRFEKHVLQ